MELPALQYHDMKINLDSDLIRLREWNIDSVLNIIKQQDLKYYQDECKKLDDWGADLKEGLEKEIKGIDQKDLLLVYKGEGNFKINHQYTER